MKQWTKLSNAPPTAVLDQMADRKQTKKPKQNKLNN